MYVAKAPHILSMTQLIYGIRPVQAALKANPELIKELLISRKSKSSPVSEVIAEAKRHHIKCVHVPKNVLEKRTGTSKHQGIAALVEEYRYVDLEVFLKNVKTYGPDAPLIVALDEIQDPHNLGAIIRSVNFFGGHGVIIPKDRSVSVSPTVAKTSAGAFSFTPVIRVINLVRALEQLKEADFWVLGMSPDAEQDIFDVDLTMPLVIVVGNERRGLRRLVKEHCDILAQIPVLGDVESLNASVATGIALAETIRQRRATVNSEFGFRL